MAVNKPTNPTYLRMNSTTQERLAVLARVHERSRGSIVEELVEKAFQSAQKTGKLDQWLQSLTGSEEGEES